MGDVERISSPESGVELAEIAAEQKEKLRNLESSVEKAGEKSGEQMIAEARQETESIFAKRGSKKERSAGEAGPSASIIRRITKREKERAYKQTLLRIQSEMNLPARTFSKVIHAPGIERASEVISSTAARPNALLAGSITALALLSIVYVVGHIYGYRLSGFEMIASYGLGYAVGLIGDYIKIMTTGRA